MKLIDHIRLNRAAWGGKERHKIGWLSKRDRKILQLVAELKPEKAAIIAERLGQKENTVYCAMSRLQKAGLLKRVQYWDVCEK